MENIDLEKRNSVLQNDSLRKRNSVDNDLNKSPFSKIKKQGEVFDNEQFEGYQNSRSGRHLKVFDKDSEIDNNLDLIDFFDIERLICKQI